MEKLSSKQQFVIQEHKTTSGVHWDLMLENEGKLWTWRIGVHPSQIKDKPIAAEHIFDHPLRFLTYEGPVQNGTASLAIVDKGPLCLHETNLQKIKFELKGQILTGSFTLQLKRAPGWLMESDSS